MKIATGINRLGTGSLVNSYLLDDGGEVTIIDAGLPGYYRHLPAELASMGRSIGDVRAVVLTHGHSDHLGYAERLRREHQIPVWIEEVDAALARGEVPNPAQGMGPMRLRPLIGFLWFTILRSGFRRPVVTEVSTFGDGATLDVPGSPRVILVPGRTPGSAALHVPQLSTLFVGDAIATYAVTTGDRGPMIAPFSADPARAFASLERLEGLDASLALPGHGEAWVDGIDAAVREIRRASV